jgi:hypothetical protein
MVVVSLVIDEVMPVAMLLLMPFGQVLLTHGNNVLRSVEMAKQEAASGEATTREGMTRMENRRRMFAETSPQETGIAGMATTASLPMTNP